MTSPSVTSKAERQKGECAWSAAMHCSYAAGCHDDSLGVICHPTATTWYSLPICIILTTSFSHSRDIIGATIFTVGHVTLTAPTWLFTVQTFEKALVWASIFKWHWHSSRCNVMAGGSGFWLATCRNVIAFSQVEQMYWTQWRLYWKIMQCYQYFVRLQCLIFR